MWQPYIHSLWNRRNFKFILAGHLRYRHPKQLKINRQLQRLWWWLFASGKLLCECVTFECVSRALHGIHTCTFLHIVASMFFFSLLVDNMRISAFVVCFCPYAVYCVFHGFTQVKLIEVFCFTWIFIWNVKLRRLQNE